MFTKEASQAFSLFKIQLLFLAFKVTCFSSAFHTSWLGYPRIKICKRGDRTDFAVRLIRESLGSRNIPWFSLALKAFKMVENVSCRAFNVRIKKWKDWWERSTVPWKVLKKAWTMSVGDVTVNPSKLSKKLKGTHVHEHNEVGSIKEKKKQVNNYFHEEKTRKSTACLLYTSPSPRDA